MAHGLTLGSCEVGEIGLLLVLLSVVASLKLIWRVGIPPLWAGLTFFLLLLLFGSMVVWPERYDALLHRRKCPLPGRRSRPGP
ncbi:MAG: hypothetical protein ACP5UI_04070 [Thermoprotei archaeon]